MTIEALVQTIGPKALATMRRLTARMRLAADDDGRLSSVDLTQLFQLLADRILPNELLALLMQLGILREVKSAGAYDIDAERVAIVEAALAFAETAGPRTPADFWSPVATIPAKGIDVAASVLQTASVVFSLLDEARRELWVVTPYLDKRSVAFLRPPIISALQRGAAVKLLTSERNAGFVELLVREIADPEGRLDIWFADDSISDLGTHAKSVVADRRRAYLGSANLTSWGLAKHFEIGALLEGPSV